MEGYEFVRAARDDSGLFWFIVNDMSPHGYRQIVQTTECVNSESSCSRPIFGRQTYCKTEYSYQRLVAVRPLGDTTVSVPDVRLFSFPTCCTCSYR